MKCDLHVHSLHSGTLPVAVLRHFFLESYSAPSDVYSTLRKRGMDLVTLTDHDSIGGAEELRRHPDFFVSEEVTCTHAQRHAKPTSASMTSPNGSTSKSTAGETI